MTFCRDVVKLTDFLCHRSPDVEIFRDIANYQHVPASRRSNEFLLPESVQGVVMRIAQRSVDELPFILKPFVASQRKKYGRVLAPTLAWGWVPEVYLAFVGMYSALTRKRSSIKPSLRTLVTLRVAQLNRCLFCEDYNAALFAEVNGDPKKIIHLSQWRPNSCF